MNVVFINEQSGQSETLDTFPTKSVFHFRRVWGFEPPLMEGGLQEEYNESAIYDEQLTCFERCYLGSNVGTVSQYLFHSIFVPNEFAFSWSCANFCCICGACFLRLSFSDDDWYAH